MAMGKPRILVTRKLPGAVEEHLAALFDVQLNPSDTPMGGVDLSAAMREFDALVPTVSDRLDAGLLSAPGRRVQMIANIGVGFNNIDVETARKEGIAVSNTPDVLTDATADIGMTLILSTCRRAGEGERLVRADKWDGWAPTHMLGTHVTGKPVGIIGMGRIGQAVARRCHFGFDMPVIYFNRSTKAVDFPARQVDRLADLMAQADIVVVTVPGGGSNAHLIDAAMLAQMKQRGIFINIARGDVVDERALIAALQTGQIAGAGLDVFAKEPLVPDALRALENVVLLPHMGSATREGRLEMGEKVLLNIKTFADGHRPPDQVVPGTL